MEVQVIIQFNVANAETSNWLKEVFSEEPPLFEDEVPNKYRDMFLALEDLDEPDKATFHRKTRVELSWLMGASWYEEVLDICSAISQAGFGSIVGYFWADEDEGLFRYTNKLEPIDNWHLLLRKNNIDKSYDSFRWVRRLFTVIEKQK